MPSSFNCTQSSGNLLINTLYMTFPTPEVSIGEFHTPGVSVGHFESPFAGCVKTSLRGKHSNENERK